MMMIMMMMINKIVVMMIINKIIVMMIHNHHNYLA